ncbi:MAG: NAD-dependent epimerase/dehydratase family protein [Promethearchaeota archaeon]
MGKRILVTGGAGFIGSHLVDQLIDEKHHDVTILDSLDEQVHGNQRTPPEFLNKKAILVQNSTTNYDFFKEIVLEHEIIFHLAASVGVGQSMYQIRKYSRNNILSTANLLDILVNNEHNVKKLVIASSNTIYGEGKAQCKSCGIIYPNLREINNLKKKKWDVLCPKCGKITIPLFTDENYHFNSSSIYALSKQVQEQMGLLIGKTYGINTTILRFFLVYGTRQALSNPYTGVCSIFCNRLFNGIPPLIFEDGLQTRDFVHVKDVCQALILSMEREAAKNEIFNVGTGIPVTINEVAQIISDKINPQLPPLVTQQYRIGDIRHCIADISKIKRILGFQPMIKFSDGIDDLIEWVKPQAKNIIDKSQNALNQLEKKKLIR